MRVLDGARDVHPLALPCATIHADPLHVPAVKPLIAQLSSLMQCTKLQLVELLQDAFSRLHTAPAERSSVTPSALHIQGLEFIFVSFRRQYYSAVRCTGACGVQFSISFPKLTLLYTLHSLCTLWPSEIFFSLFFGESSVTPGPPGPDLSRTGFSLKGHNELRIWAGLEAHPRALQRRGQR